MNSGMLWQLKRILDVILASAAIILLCPLLALVPFLLTRPFRCENCGNRFYGLAFRTVLVYGRGEDEERSLLLL